MSFDASKSLTVSQKTELVVMCTSLLILYFDASKPPYPGLGGLVLVGGAGVCSRRLTRVWHQEYKQTHLSHITYGKPSGTDNDPPASLLS